MKRIITAAVVLVVIITVVVCVNRPDDDGPGPVESRPAATNVILIVLDACRPDHLGCYGYDRDTSPHLDRFAKGGVRFTKAYSQASWTIPSVASLFTSQYQSVHKIHGTPSSDTHNKLDTRFVTLAEAMLRNGRRTAAITSQPWLKAELGFGQGFQEFEIVSDLFALDGEEQLNDRVIEWLNSTKGDDKPFFLYVHYMGPHAPYMSPQPYDTMYSDDEVPELIAQHVAGLQDDGSYLLSYEAILDMAARGDLGEKEVEWLKGKYDGKLRHSDMLLGELFETMDRLDLTENTLVIVTADHGESFNEHGNMFHGESLYLENVRVPLIVRGPGLPAGVIDSPAELIDIYPTIHDYLGMPISLELGGGSLLSDAEQGHARSEGSNYKIITESWSAEFDYFRWDTARFFNLAEDPGEENPLSSNQVPEICAMFIELAKKSGEGIVNRQRDFTPSETTVSEDLRKKLESIGYAK